MIFTIFNCFGQDISEINEILEIPDTLEFQKEIRIYKDYSITGSMVIFRMYDKGKDTWIVDIFSFSKTMKAVTKINQIQFPKKSIGKLKPVDANLIWLNILITNIEFLPSIGSIRYKFGKRFIDLDRGEYGIAKKEIHVLDGENYQVYVRNVKNKNYFSFDNPDSYLKHYPTVDELISYNELLSVIKKEFDF